MAGQKRSGKDFARTMDQEAKTMALHMNQFADALDSHSYKPTVLCQCDLLEHDSCKWVAAEERQTFKQMVPLSAEITQRVHGSVFCYRKKNLNLKQVK